MNEYDVLKKTSLKFTVNIRFLKVSHTAKHYFLFSTPIFDTRYILSEDKYFVLAYYDAFKCEIMNGYKNNYLRKKMKCPHVHIKENLKRRVSKYQITRSKTIKKRQ